MLDNDNAHSITKEDFINAIETSHNKSEVCRKLKITDKTYTRLKANFGVSVGGGELRAFLLCFLDHLPLNLDQNENRSRLSGRTELELQDTMTFK